MRLFIFSGGLTSGSLSAEMPDASGTQRRRDSINLFMASSALNHARHNMRGRIQKRKYKGCKTRPSGLISSSETRKVKADIMAKQMSVNVSVRINTNLSSE
jgi:hypothetical protein